MTTDDAAPTNAETLALFALWTAALLANGDELHAALDGVSRVSTFNGRPDGSVSAQLRPVARQLVKAIRSQAICDAAERAREHAIHHAAEGHAEQAEEKSCRLACMALACDDVAIELRALAREEASDG